MGLGGDNSLFGPVATPAVWVYSVSPRFNAGRTGGYAGFLAPDQAARLERIRQSHMLYDGHHRQYYLGENRTQFNFPSTRVSGWFGDREIQMYEMLNLLQLVSKTSADLLFLDDPLLRCADEFQKQALQDLIDRCDLFPFFHQKAVDCSVEAEAFLEACVEGGEALGKQFQAANQPIVDRLSALEKLATPTPEAAASPKPGEKEKPLTPSDLTRLLDERDKSARATESRRAARDGFAADKMKDLPEIYRQKLPDTDDPAALAKAEQSIRDQFKADFKTAGGTVADKSGNAGGDGNGKAADLKGVDLSKLSPTAKFKAALDAKGPPQPIGAATAAAATHAGDTGVQQAQAQQAAAVR